MAHPAARPSPAPPPGIVFSNGLRWRTLRNFALGALKEFGLGTRTIEERILEEAACLLGEFQATTGAAWSEKEWGLLWMWPMIKKGQGGAPGWFSQWSKRLSHQDCRFEPQAWYRDHLKIKSFKS